MRAMMTDRSVARVLPPVPQNRGRRFRLVAPLLAMLLAGCATLPTNAPTAKQVERSAEASQATLDYKIVDINAQTAIAPADSGAVGLLELEALSALGSKGRTDMIRTGDTLAVRIFEVGVSLFASPPPAAGAAANPVANAQSFSLQVKEDGTVELPYLGTFAAAGTYPDALAEQIKARLRPFSESPEAMVSIAETVENTAYVSGSVARPGRYRLTSARERLLDILALAGGPDIDVDEAELRLVRGDKVAAVPLNQLHPEDLANIAVMPEDRIVIRKRRKTYTVFGAAERVSQVPFEAPTLSLAEALARVGGPADARANPRGVFLFRFERGKEGERPRPVIYRLDLMNAESYFLAQLFEMQDKDVVLFANADANLPGKFISMLNQLFSPIVTATVLTNNLDNK
jgi:polysaccharide export outer membrane protein